MSLGQGRGVGWRRTGEGRGVLRTVVMSLRVKRLLVVNLGSQENKVGNKVVQMKFMCKSHSLV